MDTLGVRKLADIMRLTMADLLKLDGFQAKSAANLLGEIDKCRKVPSWKLLDALNIPNIGTTTSKKLLQGRTFAELRALDEPGLLAIDGMGPERVDMLLYDFAAREAEIDDLLTVVDIYDEDTASPAGAKSICFTGKMPEQRAHYWDLAKKNGWVPTDDLTKAVSLLVAQEVTSGSGKLKKAAKYGVATMALDEWLAGLGNG